MASGAPAWDGFVFKPPAPGLYLSPAAAALVEAALNRVSRVDRIPLSPAARALRDACADVVAQAYCGPPDVRSEGDSARWPEDEITTKEAAVLMKCSAKHVGRLALAGELGRTRIV